MLSLLIDLHYLAWRAFYSLASLRLSHEGQSTSVIFGVLRDVQVLRDRFNTSQFSFCFDGGNNKRKEIQPTYKANRINPHRTAEQVNDRRQVQEQILQLRLGVLPELGYDNIFYADGYEADDVIASAIICQRNQDHIVVSGDNDLYQLISKRVSVYNPRDQKYLNHRMFKQLYDIKPSDWAMVKAIAGCDSDNVPGIHGVGEKTALKYIRNELQPNTVAYKSIIRGMSIIETNLRLVTLPFEDCPDFTIQPQDPIDDADWKEVMSRFGIKSLEMKDIPRKGFFP